MDATTLADRFEQWRRDRDLDALADVFDATAPELLRVAVHLVQDDHAAHDLVQTTFLEVLRQPHRFRAGAALVPWLVGILTRQAHKLRRSRDRRPDPRRLREGVVAPASDQLAGIELDDAVARALAAMPEPYASVVRAHLHDGVRPAELAARRGCPPGTIRMQLSRGLSLLRQALPAGLVLPLALRRADAIGRVRDVVLARAAAPAGLAGLLLGTAAAKLTAGLLLAAAAVATWIWWADRLPSVRPPVPPGAHAVVGANAAGAGRPQPSAPPRDAGHAADTAAVADQARTEVHGRPAPGWWLVGEVRLPGGAAAVGATVEAGVWGHGQRATAVVGADGAFALDLWPLVAPATSPGPGLPLLPSAAGAQRGPRLLHVNARHPACATATAMRQLEPDAPSPSTGRIEVVQDFQLRAAAHVVGRVVAPAGQRADATQIAAFATARLALAIAEPLATVGVADDGTFAFELDTGGAIELWLDHPRLLPLAVPVTAVLGAVTDVGELRLAPSPVSIRGRVELPDAAGSADVWLQRTGLSAGRLTSTLFGGLARADGDLVDTLREVRCDGDGRFDAAGLVAGPWLLKLGHVADLPLCPPDPGVVVDAPAAAVVLGADRVRLQLDVHGAHGPLADVRVQVRCGDAPIELTTDAAGRASWLGTAAADYELVLDHAQHARAALAWLAAERAHSGCRRIELRPQAHASLTLRLDEPPGSEPDVQVTLHRRDGGAAAGEGAAAEPVADLAATVVDGEIRLDGLPDGTFTVRIAPRHASGLPFAVTGRPTATVAVDVELRPGACTTVAVARPAAGRLCLEGGASAGQSATLGQLRLLDARGRPIATTTVIDRPSGWLETAGRVDFAARNTLRPDLPPGRYTVVAEHPALGAYRFDVDIAAGEITRRSLPP